jgi:(p)ppGpp synthase/HD superfamily hydrolase
VSPRGSGRSTPTHGAGPDRAEAMGRRLERTARRLGIPESGQALVLDAFLVAMEPRRSRITADHHPDYLHPARTALILMDDTGLANAELLAAALFVETRDPELAAPERAISRVSPTVAGLVARVPVPSAQDETLLESLLALEPGLAAVALAERLDHARHLHLRDRADWGDYHALTCDVYAPVAARIDPALASRIGWWCDTFRRRFLDP